MMDLSLDEVQELQDLKDQMKEMLFAAHRMMGEGRVPGWMASIQMALDEDHEWIGGRQDGETFQSLIDEAMKEAWGKPVEYETQIEYGVDYYVPTGDRQTARFPTWEQQMQFMQDLPDKSDASCWSNVLSIRVVPQERN
jgi:hypothetical protein